MFRLFLIDRTFCLFIILFFLGVRGMKAEPMKYLVINSISDQTFIELEKQPSIAFRDNKLFVKVNGEVCFTVDLLKVVDFKFSSSDPTSINNIEKEGNWYEGNQDFKIRFKKGDIVKAFLINGRPVAEWHANGDPTTDIDLTSFTKGIYVIKTANTSFKIIIK